MSHGLNTYYSDRSTVLDDGQYTVDFSPAVSQPTGAAERTSEYAYHDGELACSSQYLLPLIHGVIRKLPAGSVVADLGCGNGSMLAQFRQCGWELHGLDLSRAGLREAVKLNRHSGIRFSYADLTNDLSSHPLAGKCDVVISTEVVEHVFLPRIYAKNCRSFLKRDGLLIISTPYHGYLKNLALSVTGKLDAHFSPLWDYGHIKFWSQQTLSALLEEAGFQVTRFLGAGRVPFLWKSMILVAKNT